MFSSPRIIQFREIITASNGNMIFTSSIGLADINGQQFGFDFPMGGLEDLKGNTTPTGPSSNIFKDTYELHTGYKSIAGGPEDIFYVVTDNNNFGFMDYKVGKGFGIPPFNFPNTINIRKIWIDKEGDLFVAANDSFYIIKEATKVFDHKTKKTNYDSEFDKDSNIVITKGAKEIKRFSLGKNIQPYCFAGDDEGTIFIGTNQGLFHFEKKTGLFSNIFRNEVDPVTITNIETSTSFSDLWFSTLEKGMGSYSLFTKAVYYYPYKKNNQLKNPILNFVRLSNKELLVAPADSLPAFFNTETTSYEFINDTSFRQTKNSTIDIKTGVGKLTALIKDGELFVSWDFLKNRIVNTSGYYMGPYIKELLVQGKPYRDILNYSARYDSLRIIRLKHYENNIDIIYAPRGFSSTDTIVFAWKMEGKWDEWMEVPYTLMDEKINMAGASNLKPGKYVFRAKMKKANGNWLKEELALTIIIEPPFWQTFWFWALIIISISLLIFLIVKWRVRAARKNERKKLNHEKELLEMEARALRAQMNPHFIFNCLNSIKALIQNNEQQRSIEYLTTFSKLIRTLFQNSDKRQISLHDEIETCRLYLQLETMRLNGKLNYQFNIDPDIDLKSVKVPALIIQPFIENAIWHGIVPKGEGTISLTIKKNVDEVICEIEDDGIGREMSKRNKPVTPAFHESKGIHLSEARLNLERVLNDTNASIQTIDKYKDNTANGTLVVIRINLN